MQHDQKSETRLLLDELRWAAWPSLYQWIKIIGLAILAIFAIAVIFHH